MKATRRSILLAGVASSVMRAAEAATLHRRVAPIHGAGSPTQAFVSLDTNSHSFAPNGSTAVDVGDVIATLSPALPVSVATITFGGGANDGLFQITNGGVLPCRLQAKSTTGVGSYSVKLTATQAGVTGSPFTSSVLTITGAALGALTADITFPGGFPVAGTLTYDIANGTDLGNYVAPSAGFTQKCIRVRHPSLGNFFVDFRPDVSGGRVEVVFWNGECLGTVPSGFSRNLPAYTAVIKSSGVVIADFLGVTTRSIAFHDWGTRWRFQSVVRPVIRTAAQVFSQGWLPHMSAQAARVTGTNVSTGQPWSGLSYTNVPSGGFVIVPGAPLVPSPTSDNGGNDGTNGDGSAMSMNSPYVAGGCVYQPFMLSTTSPNNRILGIASSGDDGATEPVKFFISEWCGDWLIRGTLTSLNTMIQQAEYMSGQGQSCFWPHQVDGGPLNQKASLTNYRTAAGSGLNGTSLYKIIRGNENNTRYYNSKGDEHSPSVYYLPYVLTEDPYFIEGASYYENFATMANAYHKGSALVGNLNTDPTGQSGKNGAFTLAPLPMTEERTWGWATRNIAALYKMTPASTPSWLLPKSYFSAVSSDYSQVIFKARSGSTDPFYTVFHSIDNVPAASDTPQSFYKAYAAAAFGFADFVGLTVPAAAGQSAPPSWFTQLDYLFDWFRQTCDPAISNGWNKQETIIHDLGAPPAFMSSFGGAPSGCVATLPGHQIPGNNCVTTYAQLWTAAQPTLELDTSGNPIGKYPSNPAPQGYIGVNNGNMTLIYAAAAIAKSRGISGAAAVFDAINKMIDYSFPQPNQSFNRFFVQDGFDGT